jgi:hypothetical protein
MSNEESLAFQRLQMRFRASQELLRVERAALALERETLANERRMYQEHTVEGYGLLKGCCCCCRRWNTANTG